MSGRTRSDRLREAARVLIQQAYTHSVSIICGYLRNAKPDEPVRSFGGSGALIDFDGTICVVTCDHVLRAYEDLMAHRKLLKIGQERIAPDRVRDRDEALDLAIIDVSGLDLNALTNRVNTPGQPLRPARWPNDPVQPGEPVIVYGFPSHARAVDSTGREISSRAFSFVEPVEGVDDDCFRIVFNRSAWINTRDGSPVPESVAKADLGGLSGSPVFAKRDVRGVGILEFVGTLFSNVPFVPSDGVQVRSSRRLTADGRIERSQIA